LAAANNNEEGPRDFFAAGLSQEGCETCELLLLHGKMLSILIWFHKRESVVDPLGGRICADQGTAPFIRDILQFLAVIDTRQVKSAKQTMPNNHVGNFDSARVTVYNF